MELVGIKKENVFFEEMKSRISNQKRLEQIEAREKSSSGMLEETLDVIESDYLFSLSKLDDVAELSSRDEQIRRKFIEQKIYIDGKDILEKNKIRTILTTACILSRVGTRTQDLTSEELYLLAAAMIQIPLESYNCYGDVLSHPTLLKSIFSKSYDTLEQLEICNQIIKYCDSFASDDMDNISYQNAIKDCLDLVDKYEPVTKGHTI